MPMYCVFAYYCFTPRKTKSAYMLLYALLFIKARLFLLKTGLFLPFNISLIHVCELVLQTQLAVVALPICLPTYLIGLRNEQ